MVSFHHISFQLKQIGRYYLRLHVQKTSAGNICQLDVEGKLTANTKEEITENSCNETVTENSKESKDLEDYLHVMYEKGEVQIPTIYGKSDLKQMGNQMYDLFYRFISIFFRFFADINSLSLYGCQFNILFPCV